MVLQPPNTSDLGKWEGLFVTSTSRLMLCADRVAVEGEAELKVGALLLERTVAVAVPPSVNYS